MAGKKKEKYFEAGDCPFCVADKEPSYKLYKDLSGYMTDRGRIINRERSGVCSKHQRRLTKAIKRARQLGLLPFTPGL